MPELAADLGIPTKFGHRHLVQAIQRQVELGRASHYRGRVQLTEEGREFLLLHGRREKAPPPTESFIG